MSPASPFWNVTSLPFGSGVEASKVAADDGAHDEPARELSRLQILIGLADGRMRVDDAAALMGMGRRQVYRLLDGVPDSRF